MKRILTALAVALVAIAAQAQTWYASTDKFGYVGTMTKYTTLADAQNQTNAGNSYTFAQRDAGLYQMNNAAGFDPGNPDANMFLTAWWYTTDTNNGPYSGWGNPSNTSNSFCQLYDSDGGSVVTKTGGWTSGLYDTFHINVAGVNADYGDPFPNGNDYSRLWDGETSGSDDGSFISYTLDLTATGLSGVEITPGFYESSNQPTSVTGSFSGIFENYGSDVVSAAGFYRFELTFNDINWAYANSGSLNGSFSDSYFGAEAVPEPATMALLGAAAVAALRRRSRR